jgi:hypothetical protein
MDEDYRREEPEAHRLDRNYSELLQELRVAQTGVQILFAFLLSIAFQQRFARLDHPQRVIYVVTLVSAACAAIMLIAPVPVHRLLFRLHLKDEVVTFTSRLATAGLACLAVAMLSAVLLIVDVSSGLTAAILITAVLGLLIAVFWIALPLSVKRRHAELTITEVERR